MQIERHTYHMLQCHPHPGDFTDKSRAFHCSYFMGLQRKQGVPVNEGERFDIRITVEEFKQAVNIYTMRKPGMEIYVSHVNRKNIPRFVFPGGIRPPRPKDTWDMKRAMELRVERLSESKYVVNGSAEEGKKRKREEDSDANSYDPRHAASPPSRSVEAAGVGLTTVKAVNSSFTRDYNLHDNASMEVAENLAIEKIATISHVGSPLVEEVEELEDDLGYMDHQKGIPEAAKDRSSLSPTLGAGASATSEGSGASSPTVGLPMGSGVEELEVLPVDLFSIFISDFNALIWSRFGSIPSH